MDNLIKSIVLYVERVHDFKYIGDHFDKFYTVEQIIHYACYNNCSWTLNYVISNYKVPHIPHSTFNHVCSRGYIEIVQALIPFMLTTITDYIITAYENKHKNIVTLLVESKCAFSVDDVLLQVTNDDYVDVVEQLLKKGTSKMDQLARHACMNGYIKVAQICIQYGPFDVFNVLSTACIYGRADIANLLLNTYGNVLSVTQLNNCMSKACEHLRVEIVKLLLDRGANNYAECIRVANKSYCNSAVISLLVPFTDEYRIVSFECLINLLNDGHSCNAHRQTAFLKMFRNMTQNIVIQTLSEADINGWDHIGITGIICDYIPYGGV